MCLAIVLAICAFVGAEIASLVWLGNAYGALVTLIAVAAGVGLGGLLLSGRGVATMQDAARTYQLGERIGPVIAGGALTGLAGVLLASPGLVSDGLAALILIPPFHRLIAQRLADRLAARARALGVEPRGPEFIDVEGVERPRPTKVIDVLPDEPREPGERD